MHLADSMDQRYPKKRIQYINNGVSQKFNLAPEIFGFLESFVFSRENYMISSVLSVLSCYITCIAHIFHINGIYNKIHGRDPFIS